MRYLFIFLFLALSFQAYSQHTIILQSGEKIEGVVLSLQHDVWTVFIDGKEKKVDMKEVTSVFFKEYVPYDGQYSDDIEEVSFEVDGFTVKYKIVDREMIQKPKVSIGTQDHGTVVVKVNVDRYGHVRSAEAGAPGSTTASAYLYAKAVTAAKSAKFNEHLKGPINTEGTITIVY